MVCVGIDTLTANDGGVGSRGRRSCAKHSTIDIIERDGLVARSHHVGERMAAGFQVLCDDGVIDSFRGIGGIGAARLRTPLTGHRSATTISFWRYQDEILSS